MSISNSTRLAQALLPWRTAPAKRLASVEAAARTYGSAPPPHIGQVDPMIGKGGVMLDSSGLAMENAFARLGPDDARRAVRLMGETLDELHPHVTVNRPLSDALETLKGDGRFGNAFFPTKAGKAHDPRQPGYVDQRRFHEERVGVHGEGPQAGHTIYGALAVSDLMKLNGTWMLDSGASAYGPVAYVLDGRKVAPRTTFTRTDSFEVMKGEVGGAEHLPRISLENFDPPFMKDSKSLISVIEKSDDAEVRAFLKDSLLDPNTTIRSGYVEAQIHGGVNASDVVEIRLSKSVQPAERTAVETAAARWGIPVRQNPAGGSALRASA